MQNQLMTVTVDLRALFKTSNLLSALAIIMSMAYHNLASAQDATPAPLTDYVIERYGMPPPIPDGPLTDESQAAVQTAFMDSTISSKWSIKQSEALDVVAKSNDPRLTWIIADFMRFTAKRDLHITLGVAASELLGITLSEGNYWGEITDQLIAWDIPAPPDYLSVKRAIFTEAVPGWDKIFVAGDIDWRHVSWGGVLIDNRAYDTTDELCNCIPAVDNPEVSSANDARWLKDDDIVFGVEVNGEYRAYPRRIMEVREMVNDTLGGRDLAIPYCTLCGAAQAYYTDEVPDGVDRPVLRTSGLLIRSNKIMYDVNTYSVFDTFRGIAVSGPLAEQGVTLAQTSVVTTDWGTWKKAHPETTVLVESLALGRDFDFRNNRDANGPIFPVGDVDPRLTVHEDIIGAITSSGKAIAFQRSKAFIALKKGDRIMFENIRLELDAGGIRAVNDNDGTDVGSHQAFWFAWSQFHPQTALWPE